MVVGSVSWRRRPVSPVTPFNVMEVVLPEGGTIVTLTGVKPEGIATAVKPDARSSQVTAPGDAVLDAAESVCVPTTSPE